MPTMIELSAMVIASAAIASIVNSARLTAVVRLRITKPCNDGGTRRRLGLR